MGKCFSFKKKKVNLIFFCLFQVTGRAMELGKRKLFFSHFILYIIFKDVNVFVYGVINDVMKLFG
jgi:hypothetical protein